MKHPVTTAFTALLLVFFLSGCSLDTRDRKADEEGVFFINRPLVTLNETGMNEESLIKEKAKRLCEENEALQLANQWTQECRKIYGANEGNLINLHNSQSPLYDRICRMRWLPFTGKTGSGTLLNANECRAWYHEKDVDDSRYAAKNCALPNGLATQLNKQYEDGIKRCELILK